MLGCHLPNILLTSPQEGGVAFPGADGYGRYARGGRNGAVAKVTNLKDYDPSSEDVIEGSFRWAVSALTGPRTVIFDVGGVITLKARVTITEKYITVAGQTAPGKGIVLQAFPVGLSGTSDVVIRHLRVRPGKLSNETVDGMGMRGSNHCIFDHCSISWTIDESFSSRDAYNITLQQTLISEPLNAAGHQNYPEGTQHGFAASIGGNTGTFHHNLIAHAEGRSWSMAGGLDNAANFNGQLSIVNNVVYNFGDRATDGGAREADFINNYYQTGAATAIFYSFKAQYEDSFPGSQQYYCSGNVMPGVFDENTPQVFNSTTSSGVGPCFAWVTIDPAPTYQYFLDQPFFPNSVDIQPAKEARKRVLSDVGANIPVLDDHDKRIINETITNTTTYVGSYTGKAGIIDDPADVGGLENYPNAVRAAWDVDSDNDGLPDWWDGSDDGETGWTPLDGYLNWMAEPHVFVAPSSTISVSLEDLARGFVNPTFTINVGKGSVSATNAFATYIAPSDTGLDVLTINIMDEDGTAWSRDMGVAVIADYH
ncbi:pectin lyase fold/virulence factor [Mucidula mucida]|nr:pectin lyase fold/virulence factor [Mucidula mucida]